MFDLQWDLAYVCLIVRPYSQPSEAFQPTLDGSPNPPVSQEQRSQNGNDAFNISDNTTSGSTTQQVFSPVTALPVYAPTPFSLGSNDSFVPMSTTSSQPTFDVAVSKWFDMLVGDAAFEGGMPDIDIDNLNSLDNQPPREPQQNSVATVASLINSYGSPEQQTMSPSSSSPQLLERCAPTFDQSAASEKLRWQAPDTLVLQPHEYSLFQNFVQRISHWVCFSSK
jgi:hypothetical protein